MISSILILSSVAVGEKVKLRNWKFRRARGLTIMILF
jgi:hypothetical protein